MDMAYDGSPSLVDLPMVDVGDFKWARSLSRLAYQPNSQSQATCDLILDYFGISNLGPSTQPSRGSASLESMVAFKVATDVALLAARMSPSSPSLARSSLVVSLGVTLSSVVGGSTVNRPMPSVGGDRRGEGAEIQC